MVCNINILRVLFARISEHGQDEVNHKRCGSGGDPVFFDCKSADATFLGHVRMIDFSNELNFRGLEREVVEVKFDFKLASLETVLSVNDHLPLEEVRVVVVAKITALVLLGNDIFELLLVQLVKDTLL